MPANAPKTSRHLEVERKFDVDESTVAPSFEGIAAVARVEKSPVQSLDAMYFDTPKQDLARNKITLRRRTGGPDAGWHLKLAGRTGRAHRIHAPLDAADGTTPRRASCWMWCWRSFATARSAGRAHHHPTRKPGAVRRSTAPRWPSSATTT